MYNSINSAENSLMLVLSYDLYTYTKISEELINFVEKKIRKRWKLGALSLNPNTSLKMEVIPRDLPGRDLEQMILSCKNDTQKESIYDVMINACRFFGEDHTKKTMLVIICELTMSGSCNVKDLHLIAEKGVSIFIVAREGALSGEEFMEFVRNSSTQLVEFGANLTFAAALQRFYEYVKD